MSGHSKWHQIKHKKETTDKKRGVLFSKLLKTISVAAREQSNPAFNPRLRSAIEKARAANVPQENIERALIKSAAIDSLETLALEAYGPEKSALIIECATDNRNRTIQEVKQILKDAGARMADQGSAAWAFMAPTAEKPEWIPRFVQDVSSETMATLLRLVEALENNPDVESVTTNVASWPTR